MQRIINRIDQSAQIARLILRRNIKDFLFMCAGVSAAAIGLKGFLLPGHFLDGGAMGMSLLLERTTNINLSILILLVNLPFILLGAQQISWRFAVKSTLAILALAILVHEIEMPPVTADRLLIAVFGGLFLGAGIGFSIRGGAVIDGTEVLAISISRRSSLTVGDFITIFNVVLFSLATLLINIETAMYSMLTYVAASRTVDFIINGVEEYIGVTIISEHADAIRERIVSEMGRGVTVYKTESGYGKRGASREEGKSLFCVVTRLEVTKLLLEIEKEDDHAFVVQQPLKDIKGGIVKKRPLH
jgi:uncharacterized membrane-anchored protein YitT (DUF2179 family)